MRRFISIMMFVFVLVTMIPVNNTEAQTYDSSVVLTENNSVNLKGRIYSIETTRTGYRFTVRIVSSGKWKNHLYDITISKPEMKRWFREEGKHTVGDKVWVWLYTCNTKRVTDDMFMNIRHR